MSLVSDDTELRENFTRHLEILHQNEVIFMDIPLSYESAKGDHEILPERARETFSGLAPSAVKSFFTLVDWDGLPAILQLLENNYSIYLIYEDLFKFFQLLTLKDFSLLREYLTKGRLVFFVRVTSEFLESFLSNPMVVIPAYTLEPNEMLNKYSQIVSKILSQRQTRMMTNLTSIKAICQGRDHAYYQNMFRQPKEQIKILLVNSIHTQVNKHIVRNWWNALTELGYTADFLIEQHEYEFNTYHEALFERMAAFQPDIVFHVNFAVGDIFEDEMIRRTLLWVMRHRDYHPAQDIGFNYENNMFIIPIMRPWTKMWRSKGIHKKRSSTVNEGVDYALFAEAQYKSEYDCDVVLVSNVGRAITPDYLRQEIQEMFSSAVQSSLVKQIENLYLVLFEELSQKLVQGISIFQPHTIMSYLNKFLEKFNLNMNEQSKKLIVNKMGIYLTTLNRQLEIKWILDAKITNNLKIWGRGWSEQECFKPYHMGIATNGTQLADIYRSSKIALSNQVNFPLHERTFEILVSGGFPLVKYVDPEGNNENDKITNYFHEDIDLQLYHTKEELLSKIRYFLQHSEERIAIASRGFRVAQKNFAIRVSANNMMDLIKKYYT